MNYYIEAFVTLSRVSGIVTCALLGIVLLRSVGGVIMQKQKEPKKISNGFETLVFFFLVALCVTWLLGQNILLWKGIFF